ncbi:S-layer homology domain-containing protein [Paenibacillus sp. YPG26]|uniref:S-layer homology domain-containing protein n=1 Tax=Paenibacillus sp. YPG26 TaxID=2878915 RepID=UPI00203BE8F4|nr:S-layer homology domain-containing protein [Paenibacillus sp. YPG26]USB32796.1 S-layer homology domain-containing protein [Paenibacillus sp. YPG26]
MGKKTRSAVASVLGLSLILSSLGAASAETAAKKDYAGHWAEKQIQSWLDNGSLHGFKDGSVKPNQTITRAEFIAFINRTFAFTDTADVKFTDVAASSWAYTEVAKAVKAGYITGYADNTIHPNAPITREEAAAVVFKVLGLQEGDAGALKQFSDVSQIAAWSKGSVAAAVEKKILKGYPDGTIGPARSLTRAEAITLIDSALSNRQVVTTTYDKAGTYGTPDQKLVIEGSVLISAPGVILQNVEIKGNLTLGQGIGSGDVTLKNVTVHGTTNVQGGGENSIHFVDSVLVKVVVDKKDGTVRIVAEGSTQVENVVVQTSVKLEESGATGKGFSDVQLSKVLPANAKVVLNGTFEDVEVFAASLSVQVARGSIANLNVDKNAGSSSIELSSEAKVVKLVLDAVVKVVGGGQVQTAVVNDGAKGASFDKKPANVEGTQGGSVTVTTPPVVSTPSTPSTGGGSSETSTPIAIATKAVEKAEESKAQADVDAAKKLVDALPAGTAKTGLEGRVSAVQKAIDAAAAAEKAVQDATAAVVQAEESKAQADVDAAKKLVDALPAGTAKTGLEGRVSAVQKVIDDAVAALTKYLETASQHDYGTATNWLDIKELSVAGATVTADFSKDGVTAGIKGIFDKLVTDENGQITGADGQKKDAVVYAIDSYVMNTFARYVGAFGHDTASPIEKVVFNGKEYTWQEKNGVGSGYLAGSNWKDADGKTLVSAVVANQNSSIREVALKVVDKDENSINVTFKAAAVPAKSAMDVILHPALTEYLATATQYSYSGTATNWLDIKELTAAGTTVTADFGKDGVTASVAAGIKGIFDKLVVENGQVTGADGQKKDAVAYAIDSYVMNTFARYVGAFGHDTPNSPVTKIIFENKEYTWQQKDGGGYLAGSNWRDEQKNTLVSAVVAQQSTSISKVVLKVVDNTGKSIDVTFEAVKVPTVETMKVYLGLSQN